MGLQSNIRSNSGKASALLAEGKIVSASPERRASTNASAPVPTTNAASTFIAAAGGVRHWTGPVADSFLRSKVWTNSSP
jgi:hypothetical protein